MDITSRTLLTHRVPDEGHIEDGTWSAPPFPRRSVTGNGRRPPGLIEARLVSRPLIDVPVASVRIQVITGAACPSLAPATRLIPSPPFEWIELPSIVT